MFRVARYWLLGLVILLVATSLALLPACEEEEEEKIEPEVLVAISYPEHAGVYLKEALEGDLIDQFVFCDGTKSDKQFEALGWDYFEGMWGSAPGALEAAAGTAFTDAYEAEYGEKPPFPFMRESYDAVYVIALAAEQASSTDSKAIRDAISGIANPPGEVINPGVDGFASALELIAAGTAINYQGAAGPIDFDPNGDVLQGAIELWQVSGGVIVEAVRTFAVDLSTTPPTVTEVTPGPEATPEETPEATPEETPEATPAAEGEALKIGILVPYTGALSDFGEPFGNAAELAVKEINEAGGVLGQDVVLITGDSATEPVKAQEEARRLIDIEKVSAIVGAAASGVTLPVAESVAVPSEIVMISPASTSPALTVVDDDGFLWRTTISDTAQGVILAQLTYDILGFTSACTMYVNNAYGQGLSEQFAETFEELGGTVTAQVSHATEEQLSYLSELEKCVEAKVAE